MRTLLTLLLTLALPGCAVIDVVKTCTTTPEICATGTSNIEYIRVNGDTYVVERTK